MRLDKHAALVERRQAREHACSLIFNKEDRWQCCSLSLREMPCSLASETFPELSACCCTGLCGTGEDSWQCAAADGRGGVLAQLPGLQAVSGGCWRADFLAQGGRRVALLALLPCAADRSALQIPQLTVALAEYSIELLLFAPKPVAFLALHPWPADRLTCHLCD